MASTVLMKNDTQIVPEKENYDNSQTLVAFT